MTGPMVTVTVTNYNYAQFLGQNFDSVLGQTFEDFELLVIDNASTDDSLAVINEYAAADRRVRVVRHEQNQGALASLRESCDIALGKYRVHVDADDWILAADALETQVRLLEDHPAMAFTYSSMVLADENDRWLNVSHPYEGDAIVSGEQALEAVLGFNVGHSGMMLRLDGYRKIGGYADGFRHLDDILLAARLCETGDVGYIDRTLYGFRQHGANAHLRPQMGIITEEILPVIDVAFDGPLGERLPDAEGTRKRVVRKALVHMPTQFIFSGQPKIGWQLWWESVKARPADTILQRRTLALAARTLLGSRGYDIVRSRLRPERRR
jgi:glycosyltransferase involved in cell wall biosynthesis